MYHQWIKIGLLSLFLLISRIEAEPLQAVVDGIKFELRICEDTQIGTTYSERALVGFNNSGQALFSNDLDLFLWDIYENKVTKVADLMRQDTFIFCPSWSRCLNDSGEIVGLIDLNVVKWNKDTGLSVYPLPEELCKKNWPNFHVSSIDYLLTGEALLRFSPGDWSETFEYYIFGSDGNFLNLNTHLKQTALREFKSYNVRDLEFNKKGWIAGLLTPNYYDRIVDDKIFMWDGSQAYFIDAKNFLKNINNDENVLYTLSLLDNGDVIIYASDDKSIHLNRVIYRYLLWHPQTGEIEDLLQTKEWSPNCFNTKGNGIFIKDDSFHVLYNGSLYNLDRIFKGLKVVEPEYYDPFFDEYFLEEIDIAVRINARDEVYIEGTSGWNTNPIVISINPS